MVDIWDLHNDLKNINSSKYCLDIIDCLISSHGFIYLNIKNKLYYSKYKKIFSIWKTSYLPD